MTRRPTYSERIEAQLDASIARKERAEMRALDRIVARENAASDMIGELCREGQTIFYVYPVGGRYREGKRLDLINFLIRNNYA